MDCCSDRTVCEVSIFLEPDESLEIVVVIVPPEEGIEEENDGMNAPPPEDSLPDVVMDELALLLFSASRRLP